VRQARSKRRRIQGNTIDEDGVTTMLVHDCQIDFELSEALWTVFHELFDSRQTGRDSIHLLLAEEQSQLLKVWQCCIRNEGEYLGAVLDVATDDQDSEAWVALDDLKDQVFLFWREVWEVRPRAIYHRLEFTTMADWEWCSPKFIKIQSLQTLANATNGIFVDRAARTFGEGGGAGDGEWTEYVLNDCKIDRFEFSHMVSVPGQGSLRFW